MTNPTSQKTHIFIGVAWPYVNGLPHLGHIAGLLGSDVLARYYRLAGHPVLMVSGSDCHGTPITVESEKEGVTPEQFATKYHEIFKHLLIDELSFSYDCYTSTMTENHREVVQKIFLNLKENDLIYPKTEKQLYCETCKRFLPDRYVEGVCPNCGFGSARGDQCDECGKLLDPFELLHPKCKICRSAPIARETEHFFLRLSALKDQLQRFVKKAKGWTPNAINFTKSFLEGELHDRAITRDLDWGVPIPLPGYEQKRIYVWFEAVCGYFSASIEWAKAQERADAWEAFWKGEDVLAYYVHGKDNIPFHTVIWPAMLLGVDEGLRLPDRIIASEYLTLEGKQLSKSRHWAVTIPDFLEQFPGDTLRYYLIANGPETTDADFAWKQFQARVNGDLIGNFGNFVHRTLSLIRNHFPDGVRSEKRSRAGKALVDQTGKSYEKVGELIADGHFREGLKTIFELVDAGNKFLNDVEPWRAVKKDRLKTEQDLAAAAVVIQNLSVLLQPYLPVTAKKIIASFEQFDPKAWEMVESEAMVVREPKPLFQRVEDEQVEIQTAKLGKE